MWSISHHSVTAAMAIPHHLERKVLTRRASIMHLSALWTEKKEQNCPVYMKKILSVLCTRTCMGIHVWKGEGVSVCVCVCRVQTAGLGMRYYQTWLVWILMFWLTQLALYSSRWKPWHMNILPSMDVLAMQRKSRQLTNKDAFEICIPSSWNLIGNKGLSWHLLPQQVTTRLWAEQRWCVGDGC